MSTRSPNHKFWRPRIPSDGTKMFFTWYGFDRYWLRLTKYYHHQYHHILFREQSYSM